MVISQEIHELAKKENREYELVFGKTMARVRCELCRHEWRVGGCIKELKPPAWPPNYVNKPCPVCGRKLPSQASIPF